MIHIVLPQMVVLLLLMITPLVMRKGLPSLKPITEFITTVRKTIRVPSFQRKIRRRTMRGSRPWWE